MHFKIGIFDKGLFWISILGQIDILKIDTQGYEDKVLEGSQEIMSKGIISSIESEIMFDDVYEKYFNL